jgi:hypothetical protein
MEVRGIAGSDSTRPGIDEGIDEGELPCSRKAPLVYRGDDFRRANLVKVVVVGEVRVRVDVTLIPERQSGSLPVISLSHLRERMISYVASMM